MMLKQTTDGQKQRETAVYWLSDEHIIDQGYDPTKIDNATFEDIRLAIASKFDEHYTDYLLTALNTFSPTAKKSDDN